MYGKRIVALTKHAPMARVVVGAIALLGVSGAYAPAKAEFKVRSPIVDYRELEFEHNGDVTFDRPGSGLTANGDEPRDRLAQPCGERRGFDLLADRGTQCA